MKHRPHLEHIHLEELREMFPGNTRLIELTCQRCGGPLALAIDFVAAVLRTGCDRCHLSFPAIVIAKRGQPQ